MILEFGMKYIRTVFIFQYLCINAIYPEFEVFNDFCLETFVPALGMDGLQNTHPVEVPLKDASEISQVFDKITYCKGASVIFMLHQHIGQEAFRTGIREYIEHFSYGNADTDDLWQFLSKATAGKADVDVASLMDSWIREMGFPVVKVSVATNNNDSNTGKAVLTMTQERFNGLQPVGGGSKPPLWSIPIKGIYNRDGVSVETFEVLFDKKTTTVELEGFDPADPDCWLKLNPRLTGFYRVRYSEDLFKNLFANLSSPHLTSIDRMGLFDDQVSMVQAEDGSTVRLLEMARHFSQYEKSYTVWRAVCGILHLIRSLTWELEDVADKMDRFTQRLLRPFLDELGLRQPPGGAAGSKSNNNSLCRSAIFGYLASVGDVDVQNAAEDMFNAHISGSKPLDASMKDSVYKAVMVKAGHSTFNQMKELYRNANLAAERNRILHALGYCNNQNVLLSGMILINGQHWINH